MPRSAWPYLVLFAGVMVASTSSILIRYAQAGGAPSLSIAAWRLVLAALILAPFAWLKAGPELRTLSRRQLMLAGGAGIFLALHFASWISSLAFTSVASSVALVASNPLWVGLASLLIFRERLGWRGLAGIGATLAGTVLIGLADRTSDQPDPALGNALALLGAAAMCAYLLIGRELRRQISVLAYIHIVYSAAAVTLLLAALLSASPLFGFPSYVYLLLLGLALGPQLLGHTAFNYALSSLSATFIAVAILGEPLGSALFAFFLFDERFVPLQFAGFLLLMLGILLASLAESERPREQPRAAVVE